MSCDDSNRAPLYKDDRMISKSQQILTGNFFLIALRRFDTNILKEMLNNSYPCVLFLAAISGPETRPVTSLAGVFITM